MADLCSDPVTCPGGNCIGCQNGEVNCADTRCSPNCPGCEMNDDTEAIGNIVVIIILIALTAILFIVWFTYAPAFFRPHSDHKRAGVITTADEYASAP